MYVSSLRNTLNHKMKRKKSIFFWLF